MIYTFLLRNLMQSSLRLPCHASVPSPAPSLQTMWMPPTLRLRRRRLSMPRATLILGQWRPQSEYGWWLNKSDTTFWSFTFRTNYIGLIIHRSVRGELTELFCNYCSTIIPERLDIFINKYAEHTHDKWAFEKVRRSYNVYCLWHWFCVLAL